MEKCIPYEKLSKKEKRILDRSRRTTWGGLNPVTRKPKNSRAYQRHKMGSGSPLPIFSFFANQPQNRILFTMASRYSWRPEPGSSGAPMFSA